MPQLLRSHARQLGGVSAPVIGFERKLVVTLLLLLCPLGVDGKRLCRSTARVLSQALLPDGAKPTAVSHVRIRPHDLSKITKCT